MCTRAFSRVRVFLGSAENHSLPKINCHGRTYLRGVRAFALLWSGICNRIPDIVRRVLLWVTAAAADATCMIRIGAWHSENIRRHDSHENDRKLFGRRVWANERRRKWPLMTRSTVKSAVEENLANGH